jgi:hypothetical protein
LEGSIRGATRDVRQFQLVDESEYSVVGCIECTLQRTEGDGRVDSFLKQSDQAFVHRRAGSTASCGAQNRRALDTHYETIRTARRLSGAGAGYLNIDNYFFPIFALKRISI